MNARVLSSEVFLPSPGPGVAVHASTYYTTLTGGHLVSLSSLMSRSDTVDVAFLRYSDDDGRTWSAPTEWPTRFAHPEGTGRRHPRGGFVDPVTGRYLMVWTEGVLPTDNPLEGMYRWTLRYAVLASDGRTRLIEEQIIHAGEGHDAVHHLPGVTVGHNCVMMGDLGERPLVRRDGTIMVPVQSTPVGPDGHYRNPAGSFTYTDCLLLLGRWRADGGLSWTASDRVCGDPNRTTRGLIEPTIAELADGRLLMVMRGSNDRRPELPGHKWAVFSADEGRTWTRPEPWTWTDGTPFFSPSSCSQLVPHSSGRLFWLGNVCRDNPRSNSPRYPLVAGEVDRASGLLCRDSVTVVDDRRPGESDQLMLSNFYVREDRETGHLLLHLTRKFMQPAANGRDLDWTADALLYRLDVAER